MPVGKLVQFVELCRRSGVDVSPSESVALMEDLSKLPFEDRDLMEEAVVAVLAKDPDSERIVRRLFKIFFRGSSEPPKGGGGRGSGEIGRGFIGKERLEELVEGEKPSPSLAQRMGASFIHHLLEGEMEPDFGSKLVSRFDDQQAANLINQFRQARQFWGLSEEEREKLAEGLDAVLGELWAERRIDADEMARIAAEFQPVIKARIESRKGGIESALRDHRRFELLLRELRFEPEAMGVLVRRLSEALENLLTRRIPVYRRSSGGAIDMRATLRKSLEYFGLPMEIVFREKRLQEDIVMLLDVSRSHLWWAASGLLVAVALNKAARRLKVYLFAHDLIDVTKDLKEPEKLIVRLKEFSGYSDYEAVLSKVLSDVPVHRRTTLILIGDCRDYRGRWVKGFPESAKLMRKLVLKSHAVLIMNPEDPSRWRIKDSAALHYSRAGAVLRHVSSPMDLALTLARHI